MEALIIDTQFSKYQSCFKALSDELRFNILFYLYQKEEKCVCSLTEHFEIAQSALSYHLKILTDNGLLVKRQDSIWNFYSLNKDHFLFPVLEQIFENKDNTQCLNIDIIGKVE